MAGAKTTTEVLWLGGRSVPLSLRPTARARRLSLRLDRDGSGAVVTFPPHVSRREARAFAERHGDWIAARLARLPEAIAFTPGAEVPILGIPHPIRHAPEARRGVWIAEGALWASGRTEHLGRRIEDFLRQQARSELAQRARAKAERLPTGAGRPLGRTSVRDTRSRWGSCSPRGDLSFSWRLILAPEAVLDYVVAHEVAHLVHMNHAAAFWQLVARLTDDVEGSRRWLREQGAGLLRYGQIEA